MSHTFALTYCDFLLSRNQITDRIQYDNNRLSGAVPRTYESYHHSRETQNALLSP